MSRIRILPEDLANRIAAGEVVERPASVVKELVENSLDAGASLVTVEVQGDGTRLIRVTDDGCGMDADDALLCLERHATSKLEGDLFAIRTFGFRGEAIPSIASVSLFTLLTRPADAGLGICVEARYGRVVKAHEIGCSAGTVVEVRNLFGNQPARRKFLKSRRTELAHVDEVVRAAALANPAVCFRLLVDGRPAFQAATADSSLAARFHRLLAGRLRREVVRVAGREEGLEVEGVLLAPDEDGGGRQPLRLFVNGRPVRDYALVRAVADGGRSFFPRDRRPAGVLSLSVAAGLVDVNVHPTKQEVRFRHPARVFRLVARAVAQGLVAYQRDRRREDFCGRDGTGKGARAGKGGAEPSIATLPPGDGDRWQGGGEGAGVGQVAEPPPGVPFPSRLHPTPLAAAGQEGQDCRDPAGPSVRVIGQLFDSFILCEGEDGFLIIDQHAAQERLLFERLRREYLDGGVRRQALLFPAVVELDAGRLQLAEQFGSELARCGLVLQEFGGRSVLVSETPALLGAVEPAAILDALLDRFAPSPGSAGDRIDGVLASLACKAAIKASHRLDRQECEALVRQMIRADVFSHCPHGRPVVKRFSRQEVARWFQRS